jgi:hypothetical protein
MIEKDMEIIIMKKSGWKKTTSAKICLSLACLTALSSVAGCSSKSASDAKTSQEIQDFKGHQPTPEQLQAAMARTRPNPPAPVKTNP